MNRPLTLSLTLLAGIAIGAFAVHGLHAQAKPAGYYVAEIAMKDLDGFLREFVPPAEQSRQDAGGKFLVRAGRSIGTQGAPPAPQVVVIQFDSLDKAQAWWDSPAQKSAQAIGDKYATFRSYLVEGLAQ